MALTSDLRMRRDGVSSADKDEVVSPTFSSVVGGEPHGLRAANSFQGRSKRVTLLSWHDIPPWQQDNEFILSGYRPPTGSLRQCLESLTHIHNETVNIFSHLLGSIIFTILPFYTYTQVYPRYSSANLADVVVFALFFFGVALCFLLSATFHIVANHSKSVAAFGNQLDYLGVVLLMWGSTIPTVYYGFYLDQRLQKCYWTVVSILALACALTTLNPKFRHPTLRPYRAGMFAGLGLSALAFTTHGIMLYGLEAQVKSMSLDRMALMAILNLIGAYVYAARVPEKWWPEKFDIIGSSHQILHVMVVLAGWVHFNGLLRAFDFIHSKNFPVS